MAKKLRRHISFSSTCFCHTGNILITVIRFARYHLLLASNRTFMTDSIYLGTIQICRNLNEHYCYLNSTTSVPVGTGRKLNAHKTFRRRPGRLLNVLCTFNLRPVSTGVIWQIDGNCSPFRLMNMLPFHIKVERVKLVY